MGSKRPTTEEQNALLGRVHAGMTHTDFRKLRSRDLSFLAGRDNPNIPDGATQERSAIAGRERAAAREAQQILDTRRADHWRNLGWTVAAGLTLAVIIALANWII
jgi:hypothetical protein